MPKLSNADHRRRRALGALVSQPFVDQAPDHRPPIRLRRQLERRRRAGEPWTDGAYYDAVINALVGINNRRDREQWLVAFQRHRHIWRAAYQGNNIAERPLCLDLVEDAERVRVPVIISSS